MTDAGSASSSLNKTITDIMKHLGATGGGRPNHDLRDFLYEQIGDLSEKWFKKGFNRGHVESYGEFKATGKVPRTLTYDCKRSLSPKQHRVINLSSKIKAKRKKP